MPDLREQIRECLESGPKTTLQILESCGNHHGIYAECRRMEEEGILRSHREEGGPERGGMPRTVYRLFYNLQKP
jgi:hypothetical protein